MATTAHAGLLTAQGVSVLDSGGAPRPTFSNTERITFQQRVHNGAASANRIFLKFLVVAPTGATVFEHSGNAVPGSVGGCASQISGVPISSLDRGPGIYTLKAQAFLDGQTLEQTASFTVSSPNILLLYPPNGAQGVADVPITFRWSGSGATRYRVSVGDNPSFFNARFSQTTAGGENFLSYPERPSDPLQILGQGQIYYWKVEGLDAGGLKVAESAAPFSFTVRSSPLAKDVAVTALEARPAESPGQGRIPFRVVVLNQGGTTESNLPLRVSVGGVPADGTPIQLPAIAPGDSKEYTVVGAIPSDQSQSLAIACVEFSDNNLANNCKTQLVSRAAAPKSDKIFQKAGPVGKDQAWSAIKDLLNQNGLTGLDGYQIIGMEGDVSPEDLAAIMDALKKGQAQVNLAAPTVLPPPLPAPPRSAPPPVFAAPRPAPPELARRPEPEPEPDEKGKKAAEKKAPEEKKPLPEPEPEKKPEKAKKPAEEETPTGPTAEELAAKKKRDGGAAGKKSADSRPPTAEEEAAVGAGPEWGGVAKPSGDKAATFAVTDAGQWGKTWAGMGDGEAPKVDFKKLMVVGIVAGRKDKASAVEVVAVAVTEGGVQVRYRLAKGGSKDKAPFVLKVVPASKAGVEFEKVEE